ncbi:MAG: hypothetical protein PVH12_03735, partial [Candidatus Bathyarchaeota archaeon]
MKDSTLIILAIVLILVIGGGFSLARAQDTSEKQNLRGEVSLDSMIGSSKSVIINVGHCIYGRGNCIAS